VWKRGGYGWWCIGCGGGPRGVQVPEGLESPKTRGASVTDAPWIGSCKVTAVIAPTLPAFPGRELIAGNERAVRVVNIVHPCRDKSFRKAVFTVMNNLGMTNGS